MTGTYSSAFRTARAQRFNNNASIHGKRPNRCTQCARCFRIDFHKTSFEEENARAQCFTVNNTADLHGARPNPSNDVGTTSIDVWNDVPGYLWKRELLPTKAFLVFFLILPFVPIFFLPFLAVPFLSCVLHLPIMTAQNLPARMRYVRLLIASFTPYHDNPRQGHARTQCATSSSSPPRVRASTKYM